MLFQRCIYVCVCMTLLPDAYANGQDTLRRMTEAYQRRHITKDMQRLQEDKQLERQAKDLEAIYLRQLLDEAFPDGEDGGLYGDSASSNVYRSMFIDQTAEQWVNDGSSGLTPMLIEDMRRKTASPPANKQEQRSFLLPKRTGSAAR